MAKETQKDSLPKLGYSMKDAETILDLSRAKIFQEVATGRLKTYKNGKRRQTTLPFMEEYIADRIAESQQEA